MALPFSFLSDGSPGSLGLVIAPESFAFARAPVNMALIKYWGKAPEKTLDDRNLPAVPSLSMTLSGLYTDTLARFAPELEEDRIYLNGQALEGASRRQSLHLLDALRRWFGMSSAFEILSQNHVPTAAGLASSASGMAAMALAVGRLVGLDLRDKEEATCLSALARIGSGSASRSVFPGWVAWDGFFARPVLGKDEGPDLALVIAVISKDKKPIGSREAMNQTRDHSPFYGAWVRASMGYFERGKKALLEGNLPALFLEMEASTLAMHASALTAKPPIHYWFPETWAVIDAVRALQKEGLSCGFTMDAGPNVKIFCERKDLPILEKHIQGLPSVLDCLVSYPGDEILQELWHAEGVSGSAKGSQGAESQTASREAFQEASRALYKDSLLFQRGE